MMDAFSLSLNELLMHAFRSVLKIEEQMLRNMGTLHLSIGEMHLLEAVGNGGSQGRTVSETARELSLTLPSVTVAVNKLEKKGLLQKTKAREDKRTVSLLLTEMGKKVNRIHQRFHESMVKSIAVDMDEAEKNALLQGMEKLNLYFDNKLTAKK